MDKLKKLKQTNRWISTIAAGVVLFSAFPVQTLAESESSTTAASQGTINQNTQQTFDSNTAVQTTTSTKASVKEATNSSKEAIASSVVKAASAASAESWMPDPNLRKAVASSLSDSSNSINPDTITKESIANLTELTFNKSSLGIPTGTAINFTGLEFAGALAKLEMANIVATNIPTIKLQAGAEVTVNPNVLPHLSAAGRIKQLTIGDPYGTGIPASELTDVGTYINQLNPTDSLQVRSTNITDFSTLGISTDTKRAFFLSTDFNYLTPYELPALTILVGHEGEVSYAQDVFKGADGAPLFSAKVNSSSSFQAVFLNEQGGWLGSANKGILTDEGMTFSSVPEAATHVQLSYSSPIRAFDSVGYSLYAKVPIVRAIRAEDVTVKYLNEANEEIHKANTIGGYIGDTYDATTPEYQLATIDNYELDTSKLPSNTTGTLSNQKQEVVYRYKKRTAKDVTVQYVNEANEEIHTAKPISGYVGDIYDATTSEYKLAKIDDYTLDESNLPTNSKGVLDDTAKTVTYHYKKAQTPVTSKVTVKYLNEANQEIRESKKMTGTVNEGYDATTAEYKIAEINGYRLNEAKLPTNGKGKFTAADQTVVYYYEKFAAPVSSKVTVKYLNEAGEDIRVAKTISGKPGDLYDATTSEYKLATIDNYELDQDKLPENGKGTVTASTQTVIYHYKKKGSTTHLSSNRSTTSGGNRLVNSAKWASQKVLPKTGENNFVANILALLGTVIMVGLLMIFVRKRKA